jgi:2-polyprenyl-6-methoxyphenol hydroxylase-like FAD-dependent oxidoreductase
MYRADSGGEKTSAGSAGELNLVRANRSRLRDWLATNLNINWDKHATHIDEADDSVTISFSDGTSATGDVLVGADGVHSFVRRHLLGSEDRLSTIPIGYVAGEPTLNKEEYERQFELGRSAYLLTNSKKALRMFAGLNSIAGDTLTAKYYWVIGWDDPAAAHEPYWTQSASRQQLYDRGLELSQQFDLDPKLTEIVRLTKPEDMMAPPIIMRDMVLTDLPNRRVTLVGDAAHPMTPFRGEGGNNALQDSLNLARAIAKSEPSKILASVKEYQDEMLDRGSKAVKASRAAAADTSGSHTQAAWETWKK